MSHVRYLSESLKNFKSDPLETLPDMERLGSITNSHHCSFDKFHFPHKFCDQCAVIQGSFYFEIVLEFTSLELGKLLPKVDEIISPSNQYSCSSYLKSKYLFSLTAIECI